MSHHMEHNHEHELERCIKACLECGQCCLETLAHSLQHNGMLVAGETVQILMACADMCQLNAKTMILGSDAHYSTCHATAQIARRCAILCEGFTGDAELKHCAEICRRCESSCELMAAEMSPSVSASPFSQTDHATGIHGIM